MLTGVVVTYGKVVTIYALQLFGVYRYYGLGHFCCLFVTLGSRLAHVPPRDLNILHNLSSSTTSSYLGYLRMSELSVEKNGE